MILLQSNKKRRESGEQCHTRTMMHWETDKDLKWDSGDPCGQPLYHLVEEGRIVDRITQCTLGIQMILKTFFPFFYESSTLKIFKWTMHDFALIATTTIRLLTKS